MDEGRDIVHPDWQEAVEAIAESPGIVVALGASNAGKTTWIRTATKWSNRIGLFPLAIVNTDLGQATIGPPATVAMSVVSERIPESSALDSLPCEALSFVGFISPMGHALQLVTAAKRIVTRAHDAGAKWILVDTSGLISPGFGFQLKLRKIELLDPRHLVVFQQGSELEPLLSVLLERAGLRIHRLTTSAFARYRSPTERAHFRTDRFATSFGKADSLLIPADRVLILAPISRQDRLQLNEGRDLLEPGVQIYAVC